MQNSIDHYFNSLDEPYRSCLLFLRSFILRFSDKIEERRKNNTPFYYYAHKWLCFISYHPKSREIYISFVNGNKINHTKLVSEGRKKMKIFRIDPANDIDVKSLNAILKLAVKHQEIS
jgi:hypothetical protein